MIPLDAIYERLLARMESITLADPERPYELPGRSARGDRKADGRQHHIENLTSEPQRTIARMSNWQRSQWARAGYRRTASRSSRRCSDGRWRGRRNGLA